jgi:very-short-patch-repair endonuclease
MSDYARHLRNNATEAERRMWRHLALAPHDENRDAVLRSRGFRVLRFWNGAVVSEPDAIVETILQALDGRALDGRFD